MSKKNRVKYEDIEHICGLDGDGILIAWTNTDSRLGWSTKLYYHGGYVYRIASTTGYYMTRTKLESRHDLSQPYKDNKFGYYRHWDDESLRKAQQAELDRLRSA